MIHHDILSETANEVRLDPLPGCHIAGVCGFAGALADTCKKKVTFTFNAIPVVVYSSADVPLAVSRWRVEIDRQVKRWKASPQGQAVERDQRRRRNADQTQVNALMANRPKREWPLEKVVRWCVELGRHAQRSDVKWSMPAAVGALINCGFTPNAHVGRPPSDFAYHLTMGEYIVGQVLSMMLRGMPPHPVTESFAKQGGFI